jgi:hypothetical protein
VPGTDDGFRPSGGALGDERSPTSSPPVGRARRSRASARRLRVSVVSGAVLVAATVGGVHGATADDAVPTVQPVGTIAGPGCGQNTYVVDSARGVIIDVRDTSTANSGCPSGTTKAISMVAYSTTSLRQVASAHLVTPSGLIAGWQPGVSFQSPVVDTVRQRIFVALTDESQTYVAVVFRVDDLLAGQSVLNPVLTISMPPAPSLGTPPSTQNPTGPPVDNASSTATMTRTIVPYAMAVDSSTGILDVLSGTRSDQFVPVTSPRGPAANDLYIEEFNATTGAFRWELTLGQCSASFSGALISSDSLPMQDPIMRVASGGHTQVVAGCISDRGPYLVGGGTIQQFPATAGLAGGSMLTYTIPLDGNGMPTGSQSFYLGRPAALAGLADPDTGRIFYANAPVNQGNSAATAPSPTAVTFDVAHHDYVGASTVNGSAVLSGGYALGVGRGRLYGAGPAGIFVIDALNTPPGQGEDFPVFACFAQTVLVDPATNRLFVQLYGRCNENGVMGGAVDPLYQPKLAVFEDDTPDQTLTLSNPDSHTQDIAEAPGTTQSTFSGRTRATAVRVRLVGGTKSAIDSATFGIYTAATANSLAQLPGDYSTRELDFADVHNADLDNFQSNASAIAAAADESTRGQIKQTTTVTIPNPANPSGSPIVYRPGQDWPFTEVSCTGKKASDATFAGTDAAVACAPGEQSTAHSVVGSLSVLAGQATPLALGGGEVSTKTALTDKGMETTVTSVVHGVVLGPVAIDTVTATLTCDAHGRHGTASCVYHRSLKGVTNADKELAPGSCADSGSTPSADQCAELVTAINNVLPGYLVVTLGYPDANSGLLGGTPHGYQAAGQKERYEFLSDQTLNYDNSLLVPGLEVLYVQDSQGAPSRIDLQLAGVEAESHYGITKFTPLGDGGLVVVPPLEPMPVTGILSGGALTAPLPPLPPPVGPGPTTQTAFPGTTLQRILDSVGLLWRSPGTALLASMLIGLLGSPLGVARRRARLLEELERL